MRYSNEIKVGVAIVVAAVIFFAGIRYFQDIPIFRGSYELYTHFENANGLTAGNAVRINGVNVGSVEDVRLDLAQNRVRVRFRIDRDVTIPQGSYASVSGLSMLGSVSIRIHLGPLDNPAVEPGSALPGQQQDALANLSDRAPELINRLDSTLASVETAFDQAGRQLGQPSSTLQETLVAIQQSASTLDRFLRTEQQHLSAVLDSVAHLTGTLNALADSTGDSLHVTVRSLNDVLARLDRTTSNLNDVVAKVNHGDGTLGLLVNDGTLYHRLDSTATNLNGILVDFKRNPGRYLRRMSLIELF